VTEGFSLRALGQVDASIARYERSLEILRELGTEDSEATAHTLTGLGDGYILRGDHGRAREVLEEARQALASREAYDPTRAQADFSLARALWPERRDRARAIALARRAHEGLLAAGQNDDVEEIASWLERHQSSIR
jgi:tetratricopeptide (TPR) repeat protein